MGIVLWVILGALSGLTASRVVDRGRESPVLDVMLGIVGAISGGVVARFLENEGTLHLAQPGTWVVAVFGAIVVLSVHHLIARRPIRHR
jgi:uncharacterized membrane protein YeaQ/YmgE (transglycosylase-associated protein family)